MTNLKQNVFKDLIYSATQPNSQPGCTAYKVTCKRCSKSVTWSSKTTSNLIVHLKKHCTSHPDIRSKLQSPHGTASGWPPHSESVCQNKNSEMETQWSWIGASYSSSWITRVKSFHWQIESCILSTVLLPQRTTELQNIVEDMHDISVERRSFWIFGPALIWDHT